MGTETELKEIQRLDMEHQTESKEPWLKYRYITAVIGSAILFFLTACRINMSIGIVAMVNISASSEDSRPKSDSCPELLLNTTNEQNSSGSERFSTNGEYNWSPALQGHILGSYYFIFVIAQIPSGKLMERYGCKWFLFGGTVMAAVGTLGIPLASEIHAYAVIVLQLIRGLGQACYHPATSLLTANWFPKAERGLFYTIMLTFSSIGMILGGTFAGLLCKSTLFGGWRSSFYVFGFAGLILAAAIAYLLHESPSVHPKISKEELKYILSNQENTLSKRRPETPWRKIYTSVPVYAMSIGCFGQMWAVSQFMIVHSTFLGTILHYRIEQNGFFSGLPFLIMFVFAQISSWLSAFLVKKKYASVNQVRKFWSLMACLGNTACLLGLYLAGCNRSLNVLFSSLLVGFSGFGQSGVWIAATDLSPTFAGSVNAISYTIGLLPNFIVPLVVGYLTNEMQTIEQWNKVTFICIGVVMASGVVFAVFGSAEVQPWNFVENRPKQDKDKDTRS